MLQYLEISAKKKLYFPIDTEIYNLILLCGCKSSVSSLCMSECGERRVMGKEKVVSTQL